MEAGLVLSVGSFFQVQHLFVCIGETLEDTAAELQKKFTDSNGPSGIPWPVAFLKQGDIAALLLDENSAYAEFMTLIACPIFDGGLEAWNSKHFRKNIAWLVPESSLRYDRNGKTTLPLQLNSILIGYLDLPGSGRSTELMEYYSLKGHHLESSFGRWNKDTGLTVPQADIWERRSKFKGIALTSVFFNFPPMAFKNKDGNAVGIVPDIIHAIQRATNFRYSKLATLSDIYCNCFPLPFTGQLKTKKKSRKSITFRKV